MPLCNAFLRPHLNLGYVEDDAGGVNSLPELIAFNAQHNPGHTFGLQARAAKNSPMTISFGQLHAAVLNAAAWLVKSGATAGRTRRGENIAPVGLFLSSDIGIFIYMAALLRIGTPVRYKISCKLPA